MKKVMTDKQSYQAIAEAMQQIRRNALAEEYGEDEMEEASMYEGEHEDEEMSEMSDEEEEAVAQMMDEALYEMDMEDDEDNLNEADDGRKTRRRKRLRQALLIGAGLAAAGLGGAAYGMGQDPGVGSMAGAEKFAGRPMARALGRTRSGLGKMAGGVADAVAGGAQAVGDFRDNRRARAIANSLAPRGRGPQR